MAVETKVGGRGTDASSHLQRSTVYVLLNTAATGALGTVFWLVAARYSNEDDVAAAVAAVSILIAVAFTCMLNIPTAISRFLPMAGRYRTTLVVRSYVIALVASALAGSAVVAVGLARGGAIVEGGSMLLTVVLALCIPVWVIFALQYGILVTLRESKWVPIENTVTTVAKYGLLPLCVGIGGGAGILIAWTAPALAGIVVITGFLFRNVLRREPPARPDENQPVVGVGPFMGYALRDFPGGLLQMFSLRAVPVLVLEFGAPGDGAFIGLPWTILTVAVLVLPMLSRALLSELSHDETQVDWLMKRASRLVIFGMFPATVVSVVFVGPVLTVAGSEYADRGAAILVYGILGLAPAAYVECRLALLRFRHQVVRSSVFQSTQALALLVATVSLLATDRVDMLGAAFLGVNLLAALSVNLVVGARPAAAVGSD